MTPLIRARRAATIAPFLAIVVTVAAPALAQRPPSSTDTSRGLSIQYVDGLNTTRPLRPTGRMWTPTFPKIKDTETSREGLRLSTLDVAHVVDGQDVVVTVALSYGGPMKNLAQVARVRVSPGAAVQVNELRAYGVEPITLSLVAIPSTVAYVPDVFSVSSQLEIRAEVVGSNAPAYRLVLTNRSPLAVMWIRYQGYRGDRMMLTARPRGKQNHPLVAPSAEYILEITTGGGGRVPGDSPEAWRPIDRIEITSLLWQDGVVEGDPEPAAQQGRLDASRRSQISTLLKILRGATEQSIVSLRPQVARMTFEPETQQAAREALLADIDAFERNQRSRDGQDFATWLARTIAEYQQWLARIVLPKS